MGYGFKIIVEGDYACYTRPELKVERVSYDVPTPGALEGMLKSIYWKPAIRYCIDRIIIFNPNDFINIRRNEVKDKILFSAVKSQMNGKGGDPCIYTAESRSQRVRRDSPGSDADEGDDGLLQQKGIQRPGGARVSGSGGGDGG